MIRTAIVTGAYGAIEKGIAMLAAHPGDVNSKLSNNLGYGGWQSFAQGTAPPCFVPPIHR